MYVPQSRQRVEVALAVGINDIGALATDDDQRFGVIRGMVKRVDQMLAVGT